MNNKLEDRIGQFFIEKKNDLIKHGKETEDQLLASLNFKQELELITDSHSNIALFGYGSLKADFKPKDSENTIIEVKYIRTSKTHNGPQHNECDVKNALSQIIEQALCKNVQNAALVIIDAGRANGRDWNENEINFISMFKQNPFNISLSIVRIIIDLNHSTATYQVI